MDPPNIDCTLNSRAPGAISPNKRRRLVDADDTEEQDSTNTGSKRSSQLPTAFSAATRRKVLEWDGGRCWFCGAAPAQVAHVIGQKDRGFEDLVANSLLCFQNLAHQDNAIPLCPLCHANFDDLNQPGLIFLPTNIEYFIAYEKKDQKRRREIPRIQRAGKSAYIGRSAVPSPEEYLSNGGGLYARYILRDFFPEFAAVSIGQYGEPKRWHGSPSAALRRAQLLLGNTVVRGLPKNVRRQLNELASHYLDLDLELEIDAGQDRDPEVEGAASSASDGSEGTGRARQCTPSTLLPGTHRGVRRIMGEGQSGGGNPGGIDDRSGPGETCGEEGNDTSHAFGVDEEHQVPLHPSLIRTATSSQLDTQSQLSDPYSQQRWRWGPYSTCQTIIDFVNAQRAFKFPIPGAEGSSGTLKVIEPLIIDNGEGETVEEKHS